MAKSFFETIIASGGFAGESYDLSSGPLAGVVTGDITAADAALGEDAPVSVVVGGTLNAARELDLTGVEQDGRFIFLSVRASDITTNSLTLMVTTDINGMGPTSGLTITEAQDYLLVHETGGTWRAYQQKLSQGADSQVYRATFAAGDWVSNAITIVQMGAPGAGEIGPHSLGIASSYTVNVYRDSDDEAVDVGVVVDGGTGNVTLTKSGLGPSFDGRIMIVGTAT